MQGMISWADAMSIMAAVDNGGMPIPFDIEVGKLDLKKQTGGDRVTYRGCTLVGSGRSSQHSVKKANHWANFTRNIMVPGRTRPITIQAILTTKLNDQKVYI